ncbi:thiol-disulfide oxidoreductase DCC family protein [Fictibacillus barbaricus]|uniref:Thiol-disulfide oxidoreductase DCC family protein n=1 Tax=Fictibacillus barbaricus TaxID=182136 RepID=A0ABS2ZET8_9BACL|nr:thiol-disulfide oxidoreductase DCC family protein [Fictibacillus barbaricus]MBN3546450.1 thiol-disulfide oxidoreductase DCC family protein [Fictibacillus barbaricus]GGB41135.1 hypothetical protein GCM10007199_02980 [Fictibacillus barbaricus]
MNGKTEDPVLLFDGVCNLCDGSVKFILRNEKNSDLKFAAIQSEAGQKLLSQKSIDPEQIDSVILIKGGKVYTESDAVLNVTKFLRFPYSLCNILRIVPKPVRNFFYKKVASNRYRWFGKRDSCMMPTPNLKNRFLK